MMKEGRIFGGSGELLCFSAARFLLLAVVVIFPITGNGFVGPPVPRSGWTRDGFSVFLGKSLSRLRVPEPLPRAFLKQNPTILK